MGGFRRRERQGPSERGGLARGDRFGNVSDSWHLWDTGPVEDHNATVAWASTSPIDERDKGSGSAIPVHTIAAIGAGDIVVTAEATPWGYNPDKGPYPNGSLDPIDLAQAQVRSANPEEPPGQYSVYEVDGSYTLVEKDGSTEVTYSITIDLSIPMLGMIKRKAEKVILDTALKELKKRVES